jgi:hypothetical protein
MSLIPSSREFSLYIYWNITSKSELLNFWTFPLSSIRILHDGQIQKFSNPECYTTLSESSGTESLYKDFNTYMYKSISANCTNIRKTIYLIWIKIHSF